MKKIIFILSILSFTLFGADYLVANKKVNLDIIKESNYLYVNAKDLEKLGLSVKITGNKVSLGNKEVNFDFADKKVSVNKKSQNLSNGILKKNNKTYVDFPFVLEVLNYELKGNSITKIKDFTFPIKEEKYQVTKTSKRIVSLAPGVTEKLFDLGVISYLVGRTDYCIYPSQVANIPSIGTMFSPNVEKIIELKPTLVIAETHFNEKVLNKLREAGIEVFAINSPNNFNEMFDFIKKLGFITGENYQARAIIGSLKNKIDRTKFVLKDVKTKPKAYYAIGAGMGDYTAGQDTFIAELIRTAGGINVGDQVKGWTFSLEKLIESNPNVIFGPKYSIDTMITNNSYKGLSAIKNKNYFVVDENIFNLSGPRLINEGLKILVTSFHKEKVKELGF